MLTHTLIKQAHMTCAVISLLGFMLRGWWMWRDSALLRHPLTRSLPHLNDSLLLAAGIWLAVSLKQYPFVHPWLTAKLVALVAYIVAGSIALKRGRTQSVRLLAFFIALGLFAYIIAVAITRNPMPIG